MQVDLTQPCWRQHLELHLNQHSPYRRWQPTKYNQGDVSMIRRPLVSVAYRRAFGDLGSFSGSTEPSGNTTPQQTELL